MDWSGTQARPSPDKIAATRAEDRNPLESIAGCE